MKSFDCQVFCSKAIIPFAMVARLFENLAILLAQRHIHMQWQPLLHCDGIRINKILIKSNQILHRSMKHVRVRPCMYSIV